MHMVSNERALAHWQALNRLPPNARDLLVARFLREQPLLASVALPLTGGLETGPDWQEKLPAADDPKLDDYWRIVATGAIMNEILCREAGRPLRKLEETEVLETTRACVESFEKLGESGMLANASEGNVFITCSQRHLLVGATISLCTEIGPDRVKLPCEVLNLRILAEGLHRACGEEPATAPSAWDAERIQFALSTQGDPLRREALAAADGFRGELVPDFLRELDGWVADPRAALEVDGSLGTHAMFLLAKWREEAAWPVFRRLFSLPGDIAYDLLGDLITDDGSILLAMVGGGRREELRAMVEDETLDEFCRNACLDALTCLVS